MLRYAKDINFERTTRSKPIFPVEYEERILKICETEKYVFHGFVDEWRGARTKIELTCDYGHRLTYPSINGFLCGRRCRECAKRKIGISRNRACLDYNDRIKVICQQEGLTFIGFVDDVINSLSKCKIKCLCGDVYTITANSFLSGRRCRECKRNKLASLMRERMSIPESEYIDRILNICNTIGYSFLGWYGGFDGINTKMSLCCDMGHHYESASISSFCSGARCPSCSVSGYDQNKPGKFYIQKLYKPDFGYFHAVKFGITNKNPRERMLKQKRSSCFTHEFSLIVESDGRKIFELEKLVKTKFSKFTSYLTQNEFPDGFTETLCCSHYDELLRYVNEQIKELDI